MNIRETLRLLDMDYARMLGHYGLRRNSKNFINIILTHSMSAVFLFRWSHYFYEKKIRLLSRLIYLLNISLTGADILPNTVIGEGFIIFHTVGTTIGGKIGKNCIIWGQAGIGSDPFKVTDVGAGPGFAFVGDNVSVGYGAKVIGPVKVGDNVIIGAASLVIKSVPNNAVVAGVPARVLRLNKAQIENN